MIRSTDPTAAALKTSLRTASIGRGRRDEATTGNAPLDPITLYPSLYAVDARPAASDDLRKALHAFGAAMAALVRKPAL